MAVKKKFKDFESALARLEEITELLESGETELEKSLELYTEGVEIAAFCGKKLSEAEKKIIVLKEKNEKIIESSLNDGEEETGNED